MKANMANNEVTNSRRKLKNKNKSRLKKLMRTQARNLSNNDANSEVYKYLIRISEVIDTVRNDEYEMGVLAENVFHEIEGNEVLYAKTPFISKLLEDLLDFADNSNFSQFIQPFTDNLRPVFSDRVASHILQKIVVESLKRYFKETSESTDENSPKTYYETILKISKFALNNIENFIWESSSNHVVRTIFNVLSGHPIKGEISADHLAMKNLPTEFLNILRNFSEKITQMPGFDELCNHTLTSGLLQTLLIAMKEMPTMLKEIIKHLIKYWKDKSLDLSDEKNQPFLRLIETCLEVADDKRINKMFKIFFKHNLRELALSKSGNFAVQKLLKNCKTQEAFIEIFEQLHESAEEILQKGSTGILQELAQGCVKFKCKQAEFVKMMLKILQCKKVLNEDSDIAQLCCYMTTSDKYDPDSMNLNLHGTLIVQAMLNFNKPIKVINSLLNMDSEHFLRVLCDPRGCHISDAFVHAPYVGEKSRERLFKKLIGNYTRLATTKHGSRSLDAIWSGITMKSKVQLMEELKVNESEVVSNQFGKIFANKVHLSYFRRNKEDWMQRENAITTTKRCFSDIIPAKRQKID